MALDTQEKLLIEQRIANDARNIVVAYLLLIFLGVLGAHRFYMGRTGSAVAMLVLTLTVVGILVTMIWAFIDLFLLPGMAREDKEAMRQRLTMEAIANAEPRPPDAAARDPRGGGRDQ